jgi:hypothetical protein
MWGRVHPGTGKYVRRLLGFRIDTLLLSLAMVTMGVLYAAFYLVALPLYFAWLLFRHRAYSARRYEFVCEQCGCEWQETEGLPEPEAASA